MERKSIRESVFTAMRGLTQVSDLLDIANAPTVVNANQRFHSVGLGALDLNGYLAKNKIAYESEEAKDSDLLDIANAPTVVNANQRFHSVGLGALDLNGYLAKNKIAYESEEAKDFVRTFFMMVNYYSILASYQQ